MTEPVPGTALLHGLVGDLEDSEGLAGMTGTLDPYLDAEGKLLSLEVGISVDNPVNNALTGYAKLDAALVNYLTSIDYPHHPFALAYSNLRDVTLNGQELLPDDRILYALAEANEAELAGPSAEFRDLLPTSAALDPFRSTEGVLVPFEDAIAIANPTDDPIIGHTTLTRILTEHFTRLDIPAHVLVDTYREATTDCVPEAPQGE
ncbi:hypothetical protein HT102_01020 [Hoyosella sp. G463]|uniref:Uncharacterized protein n=1 Tax=Lolliginicoccus lacisalsi TaxID=2742202 RepID=A0A927PL52_9ACTN|nr:hypothetical protein [Lolliginicoccus lacisalsi]MBD8505071.1 hypothetical protein [Lolliginicoccus lacisalsi]